MAVNSPKRLLWIRIRVLATRVGNRISTVMFMTDLFPVAAIIAFGFVYIHPLADGNGRLHRCLIHHVLAERKFTPPGMVFPVSSVMLDRIDDYRAVLQGHSGPLMEHIAWLATPTGNVEVLNDTADLYRFYDCTAEAEFLYDCVRKTIAADGVAALWKGLGPAMARVSVACASRLR